MSKLVTRESIEALLNDPRGHEFVQHVVGRALVALFERQTADEQASNTTEVHNTVGFAGADGRSGALTAKSYLKNGRLAEWQVEQWTRPFRGRPRLCKYHRQLNEIAQEKAA